MKLNLTPRWCRPVNLLFGAPTLCFAYVLRMVSKICVAGMQLSGVAQLVGGAFHVGSLADASAVGPALQALTTSALPHPLLATLASPRIKASQQVLLANASVHSLSQVRLHLSIHHRDA